ncbi:hypothetical protein O4J55_14545 [Paracoccus sp. PXZ]|nr:hypothetical protein [Paracoccus sp. MKU1]
MGEADTERRKSAVYGRAPTQMQVMTNLERPRRQQRAGAALSILS